MDADQIVAGVVGRSLVGQYVPPHQVAHDKVLGTSGDDGEPEPLSFGHAHTSINEVFQTSLASSANIACRWSILSAVHSLKD